ncbi:MAG: hypothetical protein ABI905_17435 [Betaproteobacteria bacterium]
MTKRDRVAKLNRQAAREAASGRVPVAAQAPLQWKPDLPHLRTLAFDIVRHGLPLASLYFLDGSIPRYLLLTAFSLSLGLVFIIGNTRAATDPTSVDPRSRTAVARIAAVLVLSIFLALVAVIISVPIFMPALIFAMAMEVDWMDILSHKALWVMLGLISLVAGLRSQLAFEAVTVEGARGVASQAAPMAANLDQDRARSKAAYAAQVTIIATFVMLSYVMLHFGEWGYYILPVIYCAALVFYDTRPDIGRKIFPEMWQ